MKIKKLITAIILLPFLFLAKNASAEPSPTEKYRLTLIDNTFGDKGVINLTPDLDLYKFDQMETLKENQKFTMEMRSLLSRKDEYSNSVCLNCTLKVKRLPNGPIITLKSNARGEVFVRNIPQGNYQSLPKYGSAYTDLVGTMAGRLLVEDSNKTIFFGMSGDGGKKDCYKTEAEGGPGESDAVCYQYKIFKESDKSYSPFVNPTKFVNIPRCEERKILSTALCFKKYVWPYNLQKWPDGTYYPNWKTGKHLGNLILVFYPE
jgi:hypothetical protein